MNFRGVHGIKYRCDCIKCNHCHAQSSKKKIPITIHGINIFFTLLWCNKMYSKLYTDLLILVRFYIRPVPIRASPSPPPLTHAHTPPSAHVRDRHPVHSDRRRRTVETRRVLFIIQTGGSADRGVQRVQYVVHT